MVFAACTLGPRPPQITGVKRAPIASADVGLYLPQCGPLHYETVAKLDASKLGNFSSYPFNLDWLEKLRKQAAGLGANGLLLVPISRPGFNEMPKPGPALQAEAIYVPSPENSLGGASGCANCASKLENLLSSADTVKLQFGNAPPKRVRHIECNGESGNIGILRVA